MEPNHKQQRTNVRSVPAEGAPGVSTDDRVVTRISWRARNGAGVPGNTSPSAQTTHAAPHELGDDSSPCYTAMIAAALDSVCSRADRQPWDLRNVV